MKHSHFWSIFTVCVLLFGAIAWFFFAQYYRALAPVILPPPGDITDQIPSVGEGESGDAVNATDIPLSVPDGFTIEVFAEGIPGARVLALGPQGDIWVSQIQEGVVSRIAFDGSTVEEVFTGLQHPHGLVFDSSDPSMLYIAEETKISKVDVDSAEKKFELVAELPEGGRHVSRTIGFGPDGALYVSIGSTCDVCEEEDDSYASIQKVNLETGELTPFATGLRNSVFFAWHEVDGSMWATEMGRDQLGDDLPPDEINKIVPGGKYGWPICYGQNIHDTEFDTKDYVINPCGATIPPVIALPAHVAPLGIGIIPESTVWPEEYWYDLIVAEHGSWNSADPVGYQLVRVPVSTDSAGALLLGTPEPFISGWLTEEGRALGRPVGVLIRPEGVIYVSDDKAGVVYKISYQSKAMQQPSIDDMVRIDGLTPAGTLPVATTNTEITVTGEARGTMFFEASFPVDLVDEYDVVIASGLATATGDWMTEDFVPMNIVLHYTSIPSTPIGTLRLHKDNPSGLPEHDLTVSVPVTFIE
ncbi:MAG: Glucose/sorbosone dehydrogenase-like protein [Candidatus Magasanikbacteria bacterium GW2011_GWD2_43_18]|uniref:Glucose/sorbosone dehydrogenase-like protein n=1 Tax=Candidatus Magasanikbacteria bacterium GW2011_GWE2_42_7 TaxID=1619052 RepID=A0A0G1DMQ9_9BACT|nr:MAG: Glucose/sorbosone dehydrogenase-like protein [Candidatus Magasanikbacteria bacterium GW2011_GWC2_42_27]KKS72091.1 MAG: Glucose/sorbosone dehydrogenase-like protein [Candidatus Magasanikbacteria bacterium GW2011_GWE2_42_7]KKT04727.1 MAG: Glucose/sorbosone dehydrogenase-like protein [Candidatus Magasanikbacteria bacterium GW2011_GWD2_43_18]HBB38034.1 hypothetical protein [Candidatus Magasanikbacteria bacterium]HCC13214.1 hypothetical protein [Candidatus Magasanikbacteria bacterium]